MKKYIILLIGIMLILSIVTIFAENYIFVTPNYQITSIKQQVNILNDLQAQQNVLGNRGQLNTPQAIYDNCLLQQQIYNQRAKIGYMAFRHTNLIPNDYNPVDLGCNSDIEPIKGGGGAIKQLS